MRLPNPYREELAIVRRNVDTASAVLNWPQIITNARPWVTAVRDNPPPFWAMESLLKEYPISKPEGLALMRPSFCKPERIFRSIASISEMWVDCYAGNMVYFSE